MKYINIVQDLLSILMAYLARPAVFSTVLAWADTDTLSILMVLFDLVTYFIVGIAFIHGYQLMSTTSAPAYKGKPTTPPTNNGGGNQGGNK